MYGKSNTETYITICKIDSQESSPAQHFKSINSSELSFLHSPTLTSIHDHWKKHSPRPFVGKAMSLLFNMLSRLVITFLPRSKRLLISCLQSSTLQGFPCLAIGNLICSQSFESFRNGSTYFSSPMVFASALVLPSHA